MEIVPGIHRIESDLGPRFMCQYLFVGEDRSLLVDTGLAETPNDVIAPYCDRVGLSLDDIDDVLISHADVDHCGGDRALKTRHPAARFHCHESDRRWIEHNDAMLKENYCWYEVYGFGPDQEAKEWILRELGGDSPIDLGLRGGEVLRLSDDWHVEVLHLPGHSMGHLGVYDRRSGSLVVIDAILYDGIYSRSGERLIPPRYYDARAYQDTIRRVRSLQPRFLLTAHYDVMEGGDAIKWLDHALEFTRDLDRVVRECLTNGVTDLWEMTQYADKRVGPYPEFMTELGASVRAHAAIA